MNHACNKTFWDPYQFYSNFIDTCDVQNHCVCSLKTYQNNFIFLQHLNMCHHIKTNLTYRVFIIGSSPGRHTDNRKHCFGHMKLRKVLNEHGPPKDQVRSWPVTGQFSSVGSLGPTKDNWLCAEFLQSMATVQGTSVVPLSTIDLKLVGFEFLNIWLMVFVNCLPWK